MDGSARAKEKNSSAKPTSRKLRTKQRSEFDQQILHFEASNVYGFSWSSSSTPQSFIFGYNTLPTNIQEEMDNYGYYKVVDFRYYLSVPGVFEHNDFAIAALPLQSGPAFPNYGEMFTKADSYTFSSESRQPSIGQSKMANWRQHAHRVPRNVLLRQEVSKYACNPNATDAPTQQFMIVIAPEVSTTNTLKMHYQVKMILYTPTESGVQQQKAVEKYREQLAKMPVEQLLKEVGTASSDSKRQ